MRSWLWGLAAIPLALAAGEGCSSEVECEVTLTCACESDGQCAQSLDDFPEDCKAAICGAETDGICGIVNLPEGSACEGNGTCNADGVCIPSMAQGGGGTGAEAGSGGTGGSGGSGTGGGGGEPTPVPETIAAGQFHACVLMSDRTVYCWGSNDNGQLGDNSTLSRSEADRVHNINDAINVETGTLHTCAIHDGGTVSCWGNNSTGQLGDSTVMERLTPVPVMNITTAIQLDAGNLHTCAAVSGGRAQCWGDNSSDQLGSGHPSQSSVPVDSPTLNATTVATSAWMGNHSCSIQGVAKNVDCWGANNRNQLGDPAISGVDQVVAGSDFTCGRFTDGDVKCWGGNNQGQLGIGTTGGNTPTPTDVVGVAGAVDIDAGTLHGCAVLANGTVRCWGRNPYGQLGDGTIVSKDESVQVVGITDAIAVASGDDFSCAVHESGAVSCWGRNILGQLGDGTAAQSETPVSVTGLP